MTNVLHLFYSTHKGMNKNISKNFQKSLGIFFKGKGSCLKYADFFWKVKQKKFCKKDHQRE